ncbi:MAG: hypothetical protein ACQRW7_11415 [Caulobacterales bacterium]|uniref:hypothetical protein n=1 Tax=Glycocaulis sp. TaxID=1969725 RepID=UPI003FA14605
MSNSFADWAPPADIGAVIAPYTLTRNTLGETMLQAINAAVLDQDVALIRRGIDPYGLVKFVGEAQRQPLKTPDGRAVLDADGNPVMDLTGVYEAAVRRWNGEDAHRAWVEELKRRAV